MFELLEIYRNLNFRDRIFPIVLEDAKIFDPVPRLQYLKYWKNKKKELDDAIMEFGSDAITVIGDDYKIYKKIFDNYGEMINILKDINSLTPEMHSADNYNGLIEEVEKVIYRADSREGFQEMDDGGVVKTKERLNTSLKEVYDSRKKSMLQRLERLYKLLEDYENKLMLINDPKEKMRSENEIETLNKQIDKIETDIKNC